MAYFFPYTKGFLLYELNRFEKTESNCFESKSNRIEWTLNRPSPSLQHPTRKIAISINKMARNSYDRFYWSGCPYIWYFSECIKQVSLGIIMNVLEKCFLDGTVYCGSKVFTMFRKPWFFTTEKGLKSSVINKAIDLLIAMAVDELRTYYTRQT